MESGILAALGAAIIFTLYNLVARITAVQSDNPIAATILHDFFCGLIALVLFALQGGMPTNLSGAVILITILASLGYAVHSATKFYINKYLEASQRTILAQISPIITLFAAALLLHEEITPLRLLAVGLIIAGNILALYKNGSSLNTTGVRLSLLSSFVLGFTYVGDKFASAYFPTNLYMVIQYFLPMLYVIIFYFTRKRGTIAALRNEIRSRTWQLPTLAILSVAGYYCLLKAFALIDTSVASPVMYSSTILTALGGILILGERSGIAKKIAGAIIVFAGVILLK